MLFYRLTKYKNHLCWEYFSTLKLPPQFENPLEPYHNLYVMDTWMDLMILLWYLLLPLSINSMHIFNVCVISSHTNNICQIRCRCNWRPLEFLWDEIHIDLTSICPNFDGWIFGWLSWNQLETEIISTLILKPF